MHPLVGMSLHQFHLLQDCDQEDLSLLSALVQPVAFRPGDLLAREGDPSRSFLLVGAGRAEVTTGRGSQARRLAGVGPGSILGEVGCLTGTARGADVVAVEGVHGYIGDRPAFEAFCAFPGVGDRLVWTARQRLVGNAPPVTVALGAGSVLLRPILAADGASIADARLGPQSHYARFFNAGRLDRRMVERLTDIDYQTHFGWVAMIDSGPGRPGRPVAAARYVRATDSPDVAELAFSVVDSQQGRGLGGVLLSALSLAARDNGVTRFAATTMAANSAMRALLARRGAKWSFDGGGLVSTVFPVPEPELVPAASDALRLCNRQVQRAAHLGLVPPVGALSG